MRKLDSILLIGMLVMVAVLAVLSMTNIIEPVYIFIPMCLYSCYFFSLLMIQLIRFAYTLHLTQVAKKRYYELMVEEIENHRPIKINKVL